MTSVIKHSSVIRSQHRKRYAVPTSVKTVLVQSGLMSAYKERPPYQRNDYLMWIGHAKQEITKRRRLDQMLAELKKGDVYMKMKWGKGNKK